MAGEWLQGIDIAECAMRGMFAAGASVVGTDKGGDMYSMRIDGLVAWSV